MYLSKIEITGFKSFAKKTTLTFPKLELGKSNITSVVGPNGSGKSNIADAIRWVTGEQSVKNLRGKKSEDIIFSGTNKSARLGAAEVSLHLDNSDHKAPIDYSELIITRKLYRNGDSEYLINGSRARLQDILLLMAKLSFGQKSYSIVGQGMADAILSATPVERKNFLNEAAGIKQYQIKRDQANNKLENTKNNLKQAETLTSEIEPHLKSLTRQAKKLERREELEKELNNLQINFYSTRWAIIKNQWNVLNTELKKITEEKQKAQKEFNSLQSNLAKLAVEDQETNSFEKFQSQYTRVQETRNQLLRQKIILSARVEFLSINNAQKNNPQKTYFLTAEEIEDLFNTLNETKKLQQNFINQLFNEAGLIKETENNNPKNIKALALKILEQIESTIKQIKKEGSSKIKEDKQEKERKILEITKAQQEIKEIEQNISIQDQEIEKISNKIKSLEQERGQERRQIWEFQKQTQLKQNNLNKFINEENNLKIELARIETRKEDLGIEIKQELGSTEKLRSNNNIVSPGQRGRIKEGEGVNNENQGEINHKIQNLKHQLELIGGIDPEVAKEYEETKSRFEHLNNQIEDLKKACEHLEHLAKKLDEIIKNRFNSSFEKINSQFQKFFKELFDGGHAKLTYTKEIIAAPLEINEQNDINQENPNANANMPSTSDTKLQTSNIRESVEIEATPPGKRLKSVNMLSGGERALTSIALICAIIASNPSPFVVLDEVDAALDESNSVRLAKILERLSHKTQFVVITHNRATMEKARILYGVTMGDEGISKLLSIKLEEIK